MEVNGKKAFSDNESVVSKKKKIIVLGSGPNRIGQGIEFDYCCVHGVLAASECGYETVMINCNPETVSTDFDIADKLYFEPVFWEHIYDIIQHEKPVGVIVQLGGQTALKLAEKLDRYNIKIMGTSFQALDIAEDRGRFSELLEKNNIPYPKFAVAETAEEALEISKDVNCKSLILVEKEAWVFELLIDGIKNTSSRRTGDLLKKFEEMGVNTNQENFVANRIEDIKKFYSLMTVSYTHLTLPTKRIV